MPLGPDDVRALESLRCREEFHPAGTDVVPQGIRPRTAYVVLEGMAMRYRMMADGGRQILGFLVPGDMSGGEALLAREMDHSVGAALPLRLAVVDSEEMTGILGARPAVALGMLSACMREEGMLREHLVAVGRRNARGRVAYLLCDMAARLEEAGLSGPGGTRVRITQTCVADSLGLTPVHVNRVLRQFQRDRLLRVERGGVVVEDAGRLGALAEVYGRLAGPRVGSPGRLAAAPDRRHGSGAVSLGA